MPSSCGKRRSEELGLEKIKTDNKTRVAVNLHHNVDLTCESSLIHRIIIVPGASDDDDFPVFLSSFIDFLFLLLLRR